MTAERSLLRVLDAGCSAPVGALARVRGRPARLRGRAREDPVDLLAARAALVGRHGRPTGAPHLLVLTADGRRADADGIGAGRWHQLLAARASSTRRRRRSTARPTRGSSDEHTLGDRARPVRTGAGRSHVAFVGAGPGDPGLLTLRAAALLEVADVVVTDVADADALLTRCARPEVEVVRLATDGEGRPACPCRPGPGGWPGLAVDGARVVRLVAGRRDDVLLGRRRRSAAVRAAGGGRRVVPGVSAAAAIPRQRRAWPSRSTGTDRVARRPLTDGAPWTVSRRIDPSDPGRGAGTAERSSGAAAERLAAGLAPGHTHGGRIPGDHELPAQHRVAAGAKAGRRPRPSRPSRSRPGRRAGRGSGATAWFESRPLFGWRVLVPRTKEQASSMVSLLAGHGAEAEVVPTISVEPPRSPQQMDKAVHGLVTGRYLWIGFTSVNAVRAVRERFTAFGLDARAFSGLRVAAVGGVTANALREWGIEPDLVPDRESEQSAAGLLEIWPAHDRLLDPIDRVFLPRADIATETLVAGLIDRGWQVDDVTAYRTVRAAPPPPEVREAIKGGAFDAVVFTSSSTVRNLVGIAGKPHPNSVVACIGPATAKTAREHGLRVDVLAAEPSVASVIDALAEYGNGLRASAAEAGEPVVRPSRRRTTTRRSAK